MTTEAQRARRKRENCDAPAEVKQGGIVISYIVISKKGSRVTSERKVHGKRSKGKKSDQ
ncbi:MAG: hypothetical protein K0B81_06295 [Candidatus Cloacimonetes bacterium]|nr:hypothetical protein [Candidatus Cloacimonadota bacterium]